MTNTTSTSPKTSGRLVAALVAGGVAIAGLTTAITLAVTSPAPAAPTPSSSSSSSTGSHTDHGHGHHDVLPSRSIEKLQSELAQLNYYNGPVTGYWNVGTTHAVEYLQRSAGLPQTGELNSATRAALQYQLAHGDNQMGGNTNTPSSASIKKLQTELAQLNYYDGTPSGHWNAGTTHAIEYLQRSAGLPQTGQVNAATSAALQYQLAHGDNQMG